MEEYNRVYAPDVTQSTIDGVRAIQLLYSPVRSISNDKPVFLRTQIRLNSPHLGTLSPERFIDVIEASEQCVAIFRLAFCQLMQAIEKFTQRGIVAEWSAVYMPARFLNHPDAPLEVEKLAKTLRTPPERICFELSPSIFLEGDNNSIINMTTLREMGYHFMMSGFGGRYFPPLALSVYTPDFVLLAPSAAQKAIQTERGTLCVKSLLTVLENLNIEPIVDAVLDKSVLKSFSELGLLYYSGGMAGKFMEERYVRAAGDSVQEEE